MADSEKEIIGRKMRSFKAWLIHKLGGIPLDEIIHTETIISHVTIIPEKITVEKISGCADFQYMKRIMAKEIAEKLIEEGYVNFTEYNDEVNSMRYMRLNNHIRAELWAVKMPRDPLMTGELYE